MEKVLTDVSSLLGCPLKIFSKEWIDRAVLADLIDDLKTCAKSENRRVLLVSGSYLEDQVSVCVLEALIEGFDVHLLCDATFAINKQIETMLYLRLFQAGAVPSSLRQFLYTSQVTDPDPQKAVLIQMLLDQHSAIFAGATPPAAGLS